MTLRLGFRRHTIHNGPSTGSLASLPTQQSSAASSSLTSTSMPVARSFTPSPTTTGTTNADTATIFTASPTSYSHSPLSSSSPFTTCASSSGQSTINNTSRTKSDRIILLIGHPKSTPVTTTKSGLEPQLPLLATQPDPQEVNRERKRGTGTGSNRNSDRNKHSNNNNANYNNNNGNACDGIRRFTTSSDNSSSSSSNSDGGESSKTKKNSETRSENNNNSVVEWTRQEQEQQQQKGQLQQPKPHHHEQYEQIQQQGLVPDCPCEQEQEPEQGPAPQPQHQPDTNIVGGNNNDNNNNDDDNVVDQLDAFDEESFTLDSFENLMRLHAAEGKSFILARVMTVDTKTNQVYHSFYGAHQINKVLFRTQPELGLLHRMKALNPLNNMVVQGAVHYYIISAKDIDAVEPPLRQSRSSLSRRRSNSGAVTTEERRSSSKTAVKQDKQKRKSCIESVPVPAAGIDSGSFSGSGSGRGHRDPPRHRSLGCFPSRREEVSEQPRRQHHHQELSQQMMLPALPSLPVRSSSISERGVMSTEKKERGGEYGANIPLPKEEEEGESIAKSRDDVGRLLTDKERSQSLGSNDTTERSTITATTTTTTTATEKVNDQKQKQKQKQKQHPSCLPCCCYRMHYLATDDDFLLKSQIRQIFKINALQKSDAILFTLSNQVSRSVPSPSPSPSSSLSSSPSLPSTSSSSSSPSSASSSPTMARGAASRVSRQQESTGSSSSFLTGIFMRRSDGRRETNEENERGYGNNDNCNDDDGEEEEETDSGVGDDAEVGDEDADQEVEAEEEDDPRMHPSLEERRSQRLLMAARVQAEKERLDLEQHRLQRLQQEQEQQRQQQEQLALPKKHYSLLKKFRKLFQSRQKTARGVGES